MSGYDSLTRDKILCYLITACFLGALYTFSWGGTFCFYQRIGGRKRINEGRKRKRKKQHALFATIVFLQLSRKGKGETVLEWEGMDRAGTNRKYSI